MQWIIKLFIAILFLLCLFHMPYGYYEVVRFAGMVGFALLAYFSSLENKTATVILYIILALLFQPFYKIALGRTGWNIMDVIIALGLVTSVFYKKETV